MKKIAVSLISLCLMTCFNAFAYDFLVDDIYYSITSSDDLTVSTTYASTSYNSYTSTSVTVPSTVTYDGTTYTVTEVGADTFRKCSSIDTISLPSTITSFGNYAFYACTSLASVNVPSAVTSIGNSAFYNNSALASIELPDALTSIGSSVFYNCKSLVSISLPSAVTSIGNSAFYGCTSLTSITFPSGLTSLSGSNILRGCTSLTSVTLPDSVTEIGSYFLGGCTALTTMNLGKCLTTIGSNAFNGCTGLAEITLPETLTTISSSAFYSSGLKEITIPASVTSIDKTSFNACNSLTNITVDSNNTTYSSMDGAIYTNNGTTLFAYPGGLTSFKVADTATEIGPYACRYCMFDTVTVPATIETFGNYCFANNDSLKVINLSEGIDTLGSYTFYSCSNVETVNFPSTLIYVGTSDFYNCKSLTSVTFPASITYLGASCFSTCSGLTSLDLPDSLITINTSAFLNCTGLTTVKIPANVTTIGSSAFKTCTSLTDIYCYATTPPSLTSSSFSGVTTANVNLYVPTGCKETYAATTYWSGFNIVEMSSTTTYDPEYWLSGSINSWSTANDSTYAFTNNGDGTHTLALDELYGEFKVITSAGGTWYGYGTIALDTEYTITTSGSNITLPSSTDTYTGVVLTLTVTDSSITLKVTAEGTKATDMDYYLTGDFNSWATSSDTYKFTAGDNGVYTLMASSTGFTTSVGFKIVTSTSVWLGYASGYNVDYDTEYTFSTSGNNTYLNTAPSGDYLYFTLTVSDGIYTFKVSQNDSGTSGISALGEDGRTVVGEKFYTAGGAQVAEPSGDGKAIYIVVRSYSDGTTETVKEVR